jgi:prepilin-type N-terminal cleavage/methylation domain-containing protein
MAARRDRRTGFTMIELLVALAIFSFVAAMSGGIFWSITKSWNRGGEMLEQLQYGEFAMEQLVTALRGAAWFPSKPEAFGFWLDDRGGTSKTAANEISWVTSGTAFLPPDSPFQHGLHRLSVTVEGAGEQRGLTVRAWPHLAEEDQRNVDSWLVSPGVDGFSCEWYDFDEERWTQDWEETNSLPKLVRVTLTMQKRKDFDENLELQRLVELEVAPEIPGRERRDRTTSVPRRDAAPEPAPDPAPAEGAAGAAARPQPGTGQAGSTGIRIEGSGPGGGR